MPPRRRAFSGKVRVNDRLKLLPLSGGVLGVDSVGRLDVSTSGSHFRLIALGSAIAF